MSKVQVAELFAKLEFDINLTQLDAMEQHIKTMRASSALLARNLRVLNSQLNVTRSGLNSVNRSLDAVNAKKGTNGLSTSYGNLAKNAKGARDALEKFAAIISAVEPKLSSLNSRLIIITTSWGDFTRQVREANVALHHLSLSQQRLRNAPTPPIIINRGGSGGGSGGHGGSGGASGAAGAGLIAGFMRPFSPTGLLVGGGATAGIALKEVVQAGREVQKMNQMMLVATKSNEAQAESLHFIEKEAMRLGASYVDMGRAFAQAKIATEGKITEDQLRKMMISVAEFNTTMHMTADDQKGVFRAMTQMFSKGKISLEEVNQMAERGIPALKLMKDAAQQFYKVDDAGFQRMIQKGQVITKDIFPLMAEQMGKMARQGGALDKAMKSSAAAQERLSNQWKLFASRIMEKGLDQALASLFNGITKLLPVFESLADYIIGAFKAIADLYRFIKDFIDQNPKTAAAIGILIASFFGVRFAMMNAGRMLFWFLNALTIFMGRSMVLAGRFPLIAVFIAFFEVMRAIGQALRGEDNWLTYLVNEFLLIAIKVETLTSKIRLMFAIAWVEAKNFFKNLNPLVSAMDFGKTVFDAVTGDPKSPAIDNPYASGNRSGSGSYSMPTSRQPRQFLGQVTINGEAVVKVQTPTGTTTSPFKVKQVDTGGLSH